MRLKTFNEILTEMCDYFDMQISPRSIARTNTNIIYLMFKAIAKGYEVINNVCVALHNKFNPANCDDDELDSIASIVGTERLKGSVSGLRVTAINNNQTSAVLLAGDYTYNLDDDIKFVFTVDSDTTIGAGSSLVFVALSNKFGSFPVTTQLEIMVESNVELPDGVTFSCSNNSELLGYNDESNLAFRKRIISDPNRQDIINELQVAIRNLPYIFDANIIFNNDESTITYDTYQIPPFNMLIIYSGIPKDEIAEVVARYGIYPTVNVEGSSDKLTYASPAFATGGYSVYLNKFKEYNYAVKVTYKSSLDYSAETIVQAKIREGLLSVMNSNIHTNVVTENDIYNAVEGLNVDGVSILNIDLYVNDVKVDYVTVPKTRIPKLNTVIFNNVGD